MSFVNIFDDKGVVKRIQELKELFKKAQNCDCQEQESAIEQIVFCILRSRTLCRQYQNQPLAGVYKEIYQQVCSLMNARIASELNKSNFEVVVTDKWLDEIQLQTFKEVLDDARLKQLALAAQKQPPNSALRSYALTNLIKAIDISRRLCRPHQKLFSNNIYSLIYEEAVVKTMTHVCLKIDQYDPNRGNKRFMNWVNFKLDKTILSYYTRSNSSAIKQVNLSDIEIIPQKKTQPKKAELLYKCIEKDSSGNFRKTYIAENTKANFRDIALKKMSNESLKDIAEEFNVNPRTMYAFYKRNCLKFKDILKKEIEEQIDSF